MPRVSRTTERKRGTGPQPLQSFSCTGVLDRSFYGSFGLDRVYYDSEKRRLEAYIVEQLTKTSLAALVSQGPVTIEVDLEWRWDAMIKAEVCYGTLHFMAVQTLVQQRIVMPKIRRIDSYKPESVWRSVKRWWNQGCNDLVSHEEIRRMGCTTPNPSQTKRNPKTTSRT